MSHHAIDPSMSLYYVYFTKIIDSERIELIVRALKFNAKLGLPTAIK
ncbi:hypothetical protein GJV44_00764 [Candidatus Vallotia cooleyia]|nr:hypothetical protein GJV44_00764 [Candidatus Vallotia cooleyia]